MTVLTYRGKQYDTVEHQKEVLDWQKNVRDAGHQLTYRGHEVKKENWATAMELQLIKDKILKEDRKALAALFNAKQPETRDFRSPHLSPNFWMKWLKGPSAPFAL